MSKHVMTMPKAIRRHRKRDFSKSERQQHKTERSQENADF